MWREDDELAHIEDTLRSESLDFSTEDHSPKPTEKACENCGKELIRRWVNDPRKKRGGFWQTRCFHCAERKRVERNPNVHKEVYARKKAKPDFKQRQARWCRNWQEKKMYGRIINYEQMLAAQGDVCAACGKGIRRLTKDHNHKTGQLRGLLCSSCNVALGYLRDDPERIKGLLQYAEKWCQTPYPTDRLK